MDFVWVFPLILVFLSNGQSYTEESSNLCHSICPKGYHKSDDCEISAATFKCEKCNNGTFTAINNSIKKCIRCQTCNHNEIIKNPCSSDSDVVCDCKEGFFYTNTAESSRYCQGCPSKDCNGRDNQMKCPNYQSCSTNPDCRRKCNVTTTSPSSKSSTTPSAAATSPATGASTGASTSTLNPVVNPVPQVGQVPWLFLSGTVVTFLGLLLLLLLLNRKSTRYPDCCPCRSVNKHLQPPVEDPKFKEQHGHRGDNVTTLTFNISEETPMMNLSPSPGIPEHPAHITPLLPDPEAAKQGEQSEHWPAIVLYAIIKEVPLRRWKEFLRLLSVADQQLERVELESGIGVGSMERQYQMLRLWSQCSSASLNDVLSALYYMDLSGCAQQLQESLEKLQWRPEPQQGSADHGFIGAMQDS